VQGAAAVGHGDRAVMVEVRVHSRKYVPLAR
jgi:hypothetical protein